MPNFSTVEVTSLRCIISLIDAEIFVDFSKF